AASAGAMASSWSSLMPARRWLRTRISADSAVVILQPLDVVFAKVVAVLNLDEDERVVAGVGDAVRRSARNVDRSPRLEPVHSAGGQPPCRLPDGGQTPVGVDGLSRSASSYPAPTAGEGGVHAQTHGCAGDNGAGTGRPPARRRRRAGRRRSARAGGKTAAGD